MFIDYYEILDITVTASLEEIKIAFRTQAIKWHPDRNPNIDTTERMQLINEAYLILKDPEARLKYDVEYLKFKEFTKTKKVSKDNSDEQDINSNYQFFDDVLKKWIINARKQSVNLAKQTIEDFKGMAKVGIKEGYKASKEVFLFYLFLSVIIFIVTKSCNH